LILFLFFKGSTYKFTLDFDFIQGEVKINTEGGQAGHQAGYNPPSEATPFLTKEFVELFIFNGEFATKLMADNSHVAETTIDTIFQLDKFQVIEDSLDEHFSHLKKSSQTNQVAKSQLTKIDGQIIDLKNRGKELETKLRGHQNKKIDAAKKILELGKEKKRVTKASEDAHTNLNEAAEKIKDSKLEIDIILKEIYGFLKKPWSLSQNIQDSYVNFRDHLEKLKLPGNSNQTFFREIVEEKLCICDEPMTPARKKNILKNSEKFMGSGFSQFLQVMKEDVQLHIISSPNNIQEELNINENKLKVAKTELLEWEQKETILKEQVLTITGRTHKEIDADIENQVAIKEQCNNFEDRYQEVDKDISITIRPRDIFSKANVENLINKLKKTQNLSISLNKTQRNVDAIKKLLNKMRNKTREAIKEQLKDKMNKRLESVVEDDKITVSNIEQSVEHSGASEGQSLALAYIFLNEAFSLADESHQFPLFVDSPAGKIGQVYRENLAKMIVELCPNQFICLLQGGEREWWCDTLYEKSKDSIIAYTIFRRAPFYEQYFNKDKYSDLIEYENSGMVKGYEFLKNFAGKKNEE